jgi:micrococcal nuclease
MSRFRHSRSLTALVLLPLLAACTPVPSSTPQPTASAPTISVPATATSATVNYVHDGDTLFLTTPADANLKVRLIGVDTPEVGDSAECYGDEATELLRSLLPEGSEVVVAPDVEPFDRYGRSLLYVFTPDGTFVNFELVRQGAGEALRVGENDAYYPELVEAQDAAADAALGIWGAC